MKLKSIIVLGIITLSTILGCKRDNLKSLSELKDDQADNIERIIKENNWKVVKLNDDKFPSKIDYNVYYLFPNGLYIKVIDEGNNEKAIKDKTHIFLYAKGYITNSKDKKFGTFDSLSDGNFMPIEFIYTEYYYQGYFHYRELPQITNGYSISQIMCEGLAYPMSLLGNNARVSLIIPFELAPNFTYTNGSSIVVQEANYSFKK